MLLWFLILIYQLVMFDPKLCIPRKKDKWRYVNSLYKQNKKYKLMNDVHFILIEQRFEYFMVKEWLIVVVCVVFHFDWTTFWILLGRRSGLQRSCSHRASDCCWWASLCPVEDLLNDDVLRAQVSKNKFWLFFLFWYLIQFWLFCLGWNSNVHDNKSDNII